MELLVGAAIAGVALGGFVTAVIWRIVFRAVDNGFD
jgi:hypothetical protein